MTPQTAPLNIVEAPETTITPTNFVTGFLADNRLMSTSAPLAAESVADYLAANESKPAASRNFTAAERMLLKERKAILTKLRPLNARLKQVDAMLLAGDVPLS
jgi:hypothetical protein